MILYTMSTCNADASVAQTCLGSQSLDGGQQVLRLQTRLDSGALPAGKNKELCI